MPASVVSASSVCFEYREREILHSVDLAIHEGDRLALVGSNGSGKTTLLRLLAGELAPTTGSIERSGAANIAYLPQVDRGSEHPIRQEVSELIGLAAAERELDRLTDRLADGDLAAVERQATAIERWVTFGGEDFEARLRPALASIGIDPAWAERRCSTLSGGQLARVRLAALELARLDLALLDEPSNHLDSEGLYLLDRLLADAGYALVIASHDRRLLDAVASDVLELNRGRATRYGGGWSTYLRERETARRDGEIAYGEAVAERDRLVKIERRMRRWAEVGVKKARRNSENDKIVRNARIESAEKNAAANGIGKRIEKLEIPEKPWRENLSRLLLDSAQEVHSAAVASLREVEIHRGRWRLGPINLVLAPGERILLSGENGSGKSSLIAAMAGRLAPDSGTIEVPGASRMVELGQRRGAFGDGDESLVTAFRRLSGLDETSARGALASMRLDADRAERRPRDISPGESTRAQLALLARTGAACLLLDEPGNHLDIEAQEVLEAALEGWSGALVMASHDREMRAKVRIDRTVDLEELSGYPDQPMRSSTSSITESTSSSS